MTTPPDASAVAPVVITGPASSHLQCRFLGYSPPEGVVLKKYWEIGAPASAPGEVAPGSGPWD